MTRLYLDTEFNGFGGELISMALVSPGVQKWYGVRLPNERIDGPIDPWVREHVMPKLDFGRPPLSDTHFRNSLHAFLLQFYDPEIICDWHADAVHFCQWLAGEDYGSSLDWPCRITILKTPPGQPISEMPHNALADAQALMKWNEARMQQPKQAAGGQR